MLLRRRDWILLAACAFAEASCGSADITTPGVDLWADPIPADAVCALRYDQVEPPEVDFTGRGIESAFVSAEAQIPGFAGFYLDSAKNIVMHVKSPVPDNAVQVFESLFLATDFERALLARPDGSAPDIRVVPVDYAMSELIVWFQMILGNAGAGCGIHSMDADERLNRVRLAVTRKSRVDGVRRLFDALSIPQEAVVVEVRPMAIALLHGD